MDLSIIIVNWNTCSLLEKCLESIIKFTQSIQFELIVVDNGSIDDSVNAIESSFPSVKLIKNKKNLGFSKAVNQGIKISQGENVLLLNSDTYLTGNSFARMVGLMNTKKHVGAMTCKVLYPDGRSQSAYCRFPSLPGMIYEFLSISKHIAHSKIFYKYDVSQWDYSMSRELKDDLWPGGGCLMIKKEVLKTVGTMDENFGYAYMEDTDLCYRIKSSGYSFYYLAEVTIYHHHSYTVLNSSQDFKDILTINLQQNKYYFYKKHYGSRDLLILKALDIFKNTLIESYWLLTYFFTLKQRGKNKRKIKLYLRLIAGCFVAHRIE